MLPSPEGPSVLDDLVREGVVRSGLGLTRTRRTLLGETGPVARLGGAADARISFLSNDYLGLASHPRLRDALASGAQRWGAGAGASPLVSGHLGCHAEAEAVLAACVGMEAALLFITGYMANLAVLTSLIDDAADLIFSDSLNHASLIDGCRLARGRTVRYPHLDLAALEEALRSHPGRRRLIVTDAVFSMDGDQADLAALLQLAETYDALLLVDDAHGFGVLGPAGRGSVAAAGLCSSRLIVMGTLGKAAGLSGAFVAGDARVVDHLVQRSRTYIYSTSPAPCVAAAVPTAIELLLAADDRRMQLDALRAQLAEFASHWRVPAWVGETPIVPVLVGDAGKTMALAQGLAEQGVLVAGIRPPTVPEGESRLRISLSASHTADHLGALAVAAVAAGLAG